MSIKVDGRGPQLHASYYGYPWGPDEPSKDWFDEGATWRPTAPVFGWGDDRFTLLPTPPRGATTVSLRVNTTDNQGGTVTQEVLRAYGIA